MELLTVPEVAKRLRLGKSTVYLMTEHGELPVVRFGKSVRIPAEKLDQWIKDRIEHPTPEPPCDARREYCSLEGLDRTIVDVSPRPVPFSGDLANRTNSGRLIRTDEIGQPPPR